MNTLQRPIIINFAPTGMVPTKKMTPHIPITATEIIEQTHEAHELGITLVHLHARDEQGLPTYRNEYYSKIIEGVRKHCPDLVICASLSGRTHNTLETRSEVLQLGVDMGSLTLSSLNFPQQASVNDPEMIKGLCLKMKETGTNAELEVFDLGMINYAKYLMKRGLLSDPSYFNIILGNIAGMQAEAHHVAAALKDLPDGAYWALGGIGDSQLSANKMGMEQGGGVRVGLEDNIFYDQARTELATNMGLLKRVHDFAESLERSVMKSSDFGELGFYNKFRNESTVHTGQKHLRNFYNN